MSRKNLPLIIGAALFTLILVFLFNRADNYAWFLILGAIFLAFTILVNIQSVEAGLMLLIFTLPFEYVGAFSLSGGAIGFKIRSSMIAGGVLIFFWLLNFIKGRIKARPNYLLPFILLFLAALILSFLRATDLTRALLVFVYTLFPITIALILPQIITDQKILKKALWVWFFTALLVSLFGFFQFFGDLMGLPINITFLREMFTKRVFGLPRIQGTALEPLLFANYLMAPIALALSLLVAHQKAINKKFLILMLIPALLAFIFTMSRGGYLGLITAFLFIAFVYFRRFFRLKIILGTLGVIIAVGFLGYQIFKISNLNIHRVDALIDHFTNISRDASNLERFVTYGAAWELFNNSPIFGIGLGNYGPHLARYPATPPIYGWATVNNETLEIMAELGLIGLFFALLIPIRVLIQSFRVYRQNSEPFLKAVNVGASAALLGMLVQWQFFSTLYTIQIWALIGLLVAVHNLNAKFKSQNAK